MNISKFIGVDKFPAPIGFLGTALFIIVAFFLIREIIVWYWKINRVVELLEQIEENTRPKISVHTKEKDRKDDYEHGVVNEAFTKIGL